MAGADARDPSDTQPVLRSDSIFFVPDLEQMVGGPLGLYMANESMVPAFFRVHKDLSLSFFPSRTAKAHIGPQACSYALPDVLQHLIETRVATERIAWRQLGLLDAVGLGLEKVPRNGISV